MRGQRFRAERSRLKIAPAPWHVFDFETGMIARHPESGKLLYCRTGPMAKKVAAALNASQGKRAT